MKRYIISGATGSVGKRISEMLHVQRDSVCILSRKRGFEGIFYKYKWDVKNNQTDTKWLTETDTIIHLEGSNVAYKKWDESYRKEVYDNRLRSTKMLHQLLKNSVHTVKTIVVASEIGIYGNEIKGIADENTGSANTYLAKLCQDWENEIEKFNALGIRVVIIRLGIVFSPGRGVINKISNPIKKYIGAASGNGKQMISWVHIDDLSRMFIKAAEDTNMHGVYNAVAPEPLSNAELTKKIAKTLKKPLLLPNIPVYAMKFWFGEIAAMLLADQHVSSQKIQDTGFVFDFPHIDSVLADVMEQ